MDSTINPLTNVYRRTRAIYKSYEFSIEQVREAVEKTLPQGIPEGAFIEHLEHHLLVLSDDIHMRRFLSTLRSLVLGVKSNHQSYVHQ